MERDYPGFSGLVSERVLLNAHSMAGYLNTPQGAVYGFEPLPPEDPIFPGFPRTPRTPVGGLYLASAFGGEHGFNGAIFRARRRAARGGEGWRWGWSNPFIFCFRRRNPFRRLGVIGRAGARAASQKGRGPIFRKRRGTRLA